MKQVHMSTVGANMSADWAQTSRGLRSSGMLPIYQVEFSLIF